MQSLSAAALASICFNILCSIVLVILNKRLVVELGFKFMTVLSGLHFAASFFACMLMICTGVQRYKSVNSYWSIFRVSLGSLLSVVFMNYCLSHSTVGFYQVVKLFGIPLTLFFESLYGLRQEHLTWRLLLSLAITVTGMVLVIREEISTGAMGIIWGILGIVTTALSQVFFAPLKKGLALDAFQLLFHTSPWLTFGSFIMVPTFEDVDELIAYNLSGGVVWSLLLTCVVAVAFNISNYIVLSEITPLSYSIMGHLKTVVIISVGAYMFNTYPSSVMLLGMLTAVLGVLMFTLEKEHQMAAHSQCRRTGTPPRLAAPIKHTAAPIKHTAATAASATAPTVASSESLDEKLDRAVPFNTGPGRKSAVNAGAPADAADDAADIIGAPSMPFGGKAEQLPTKLQLLKDARREGFLRV